MSQEELERLWDPSATASGADAVGDLERRLSSLRGPQELPPLSLPPRSATKEPPPQTVSEEVMRTWALVAMLILIASVLMAWFATRPSRQLPADFEPLAQAPSRADYPIREGATPRGGEDVWRVDDFAGQAQCERPGMVGVVEDRGPLPESVDLDVGPGSTARLSKGEASVEVHPNSQVRRVGDALELGHGRAWVDLPARDDEGEWVLRTREVTLQTIEARFVWWAFEELPEQDSAPQRIGQELGVEIVSGRVEFEIDGKTIVGEPGQTCRAHGDDSGRLGPVVCAPTESSSP